MKAWRVFDKDCTTGTEIIFAETRGKAISYALSYCDFFEDLSWTDVRAKRFKEFDKYYNGKQNPSFWFDDKIRVILVRDFDWGCFDDCYDGLDCPAYNFCKRRKELNE